MRRLFCFACVVGLMVAALTPASSAEPPVGATYEAGVLCIRVGSSVSCASPAEGPQEPPILDEVEEIIPSVTLGDDGLCLQSGKLVTLEVVCTGEITDPLLDFQVEFDPNNPLRGVCLTKHDGTEALCTGEIHVMSPVEVSFDDANGVCVYARSPVGDQPAATCTGPITQQLLRDVPTITWDDEDGVCITSVATATMGLDRICTGPIDNPLDDEIQAPSVSYSPEQGVCITSGTGVHQCSGPLQVSTPVPQAQISVRHTSGVPVVDGWVAVYLEPYEVGEVYTPLPIASGRTDSNGAFDVKLPPPLIADFEADGAILPRERYLNLYVRAIDKLKTRRANWYFVVDLQQPVTRVTAVADEDLTAHAMYATATEQELVFADTRVLAGVPHPINNSSPGAEEGQPLPELDEDEGGSWKAHVDKKIKVFELHVANGMRGQVDFAKGRETQAEVATTVCYESCEKWKVGGWITEKNSREQGGHFERADWYHHAVGGLYRKGKWMYCAGSWIYPDNKPKWCYGKGYEWKIRSFLGTLHEKAFETQPDFLLSNSQELEPGAAYWKHTKRNSTMGAAFRLVGLDLSAQAGYSDITSARWEYKSTGCSNKRYVFGRSDKPGATNGIIFAHCAP